MTELQFSCTGIIFIQSTLLFWFVALELSKTTEPHHIELENRSAVLLSTTENTTCRNIARAVAFRGEFLSPAFASCLEHDMQSYAVVCTTTFAESARTGFILNSGRENRRQDESPLVYTHDNLAATKNLLCVNECECSFKTD